MITGHGPIFPPVRSDTKPARPYIERGARAEYKQTYCDGGCHHGNGVSAAPRPTPMGGAGLPISRLPFTMSTGHAAGSQPPSATNTKEAAARPHNEDPCPRDGEELSQTARVSLSLGRHPRCPELRRWFLVTQCHERVNSRPFSPSLRMTARTVTYPTRSKQGKENGEACEPCH